MSRAGVVTASDFLIVGPFCSLRSWRTLCPLRFSLFLFLRVGEP